jgi:hypothetical protein
MGAGRRRGGGEVLLHGRGGCGHGGEKSGRRGAAASACQTIMTTDYLQVGKYGSIMLTRSDDLRRSSQGRRLLLLGICLDKTTTILDTETVGWSWVDRKVGLSCRATSGCDGRDWCDLGVCDVERNRVVPPCRKDLFERQ